MVTRRKIRIKGQSAAAPIPEPEQVEAQPDKPPAAAPAAAPVGVSTAYLANELNTLMRLFRLGSISPTSALLHLNTLDAAHKGLRSPTAVNAITDMRAQFLVAIRDQDAQDFRLSMDEARDSERQEQERRHHHLIIFALCIGAASSVMAVVRILFGL